MIGWGAYLVVEGCECLVSSLGVLVEPRRVATMDPRVAIFSGSRVDVYYKIGVGQGICNVGGGCQNVLWGC